MKNKKKSYNPLKILGNWIGGGIGGLIGVNLMIANKLYNCEAEIGSLGCTASFEEKIIGGFIGFLIGFLLIWGVYSLIMYLRKE